MSVEPEITSFGEPGCSTWGFPEEAIDSNSEIAIQKLYKSLECPVCHEFPSGTVYSCKDNMHMICENCFLSVSANSGRKNCPSCSATVPEERSYKAESCIANFLIPCKHKFQGCPQIIRGRNIREHINTCTYRPIKCIMSKCDASLQFREIFNHLLSTHGKKVNGVDNTNRHTIEWWIEGDIFAPARWPPFYLTCYNNVFLYFCISTVHGTWEFCQILNNEEEAKRFRIEAKMENVEAALSLKYSGPVHSIRKPVMDIVASGKVFITNSKEVRNPFMYRRNDSKSFWRTEVTIHQVSPPIPSSMPYVETKDDARLMISKPKDNWTYTIDTSEKATDYQAKLLSGTPYNLVQTSATPAKEPPKPSEPDVPKNTQPEPSAPAPAPPQAEEFVEVLPPKMISMMAVTEMTDIEAISAMEEGELSKQDLTLRKSKTKIDIGGDLPIVQSDNKIVDVLEDELEEIMPNEEEVQNAAETVEVESTD